MSEDTQAPSTAETPPPSGTETTQTAPVTTTTEAPKDGGTIMDSPGDKPAAGPANFPDNWRSLVADGDEKLAKELERYADPKAFAKSWKEQKAAISKGAAKSPLPEGATPEQVAQWREANGIPAKADDYKIELPNGLTIGEQDKPIVGKIMEVAHAENLTPKQLNSVVSKYYEIQEEQAAQMLEAVKQSRSQAAEELRADWGAEFLTNVNTAKTLVVKTFGEEVAAEIMAAADANGIPLGNNPKFMRGLVALAREAMLEADPVPAGTGDRLQSVEAEIAKYETDMRTDLVAWHRDGKKQERYRTLLAAQEKLKGRSAA